MTKVALVNIIKDLECAPLGLVYLGTFLKKKNNSEVKIIDINFQEILGEIKKFNPDIIGLSAHTIAINSAKKIARKIKKISKAKIILGGVHISTHEDSFGKEFDIAVLGEGEETLSEIVNIFEKKKFNAKNLGKIKGILFWENGKVTKTERRELMKDLKKIPIPDRRIIDKEYFKEKISYNKIREKKVVEAGMLTSRGCPYKCAFCSAAAFWDKIRFHSPEFVAEEIKDLVENFNVNYIVMYDDFFTASVKRLEETKKELEKNKILGKVKISCSARANVINDKLCEAMKNLGVVTVNFGFESGSDKILKMLKGTNVNVRQNLNAVKLCRKYGLEVTGSFIVGSPEEKLMDMGKTFEVMKEMKKLGVSELWCGVAVPYPGTRLWEYGMKKGLLKNYNFDLADPSNLHSHIFLDKSVNEREFFKIFKKIKELSQEINPRHQTGIKKKIKEVVYYNKFLYNASKKILNKSPSKLKKWLVKIFGIKGSLSGK